MLIHQITSGFNYFWDSSFSCGSFFSSVSFFSGLKSFVIFVSDLKMKDSSFSWKRP